MFTALSSNYFIDFLALGCGFGNRFPGAILGAALDDRHHHSRHNTELQLEVYELHSNILVIDDLVRRAAG